MLVFGGTVDISSTRIADAEVKSDRGVVCLVVERIPRGIGDRVIGDDVVYRWCDCLCGVE